MFFESFKITGAGIGQIIILGGVGFFLVKRDILKKEALHFLSRLVIEVTLSAMIFCQLMSNFSFSAYVNWWVFPILSAAVTSAGLLIGLIFSVFIKELQKKLQFLSLITFQNSAFIPIVLVAALLPKESADKMMVYLFLFLLGFNAAILSFGVYLLTFTKAKKFEINSLFNPPVIATIASLVFVYFGLPRFVPEFVFRPLKMIGDCTVPLSMFIVSANLAEIKLRHIDKAAMFFTVLAKLVILPLLGVLLVVKFKIDCLIGLLIVMQLAVPSATLLSVIMTHHKREDFLISQGVFFTHIASIITVPLFLSLYFALVGWPGCVR